MQFQLEATGYSNTAQLTGINRFLPLLLWKSRDTETPGIWASVLTHMQGRKTMK